MITPKFQVKRRSLCSDSVGDPGPRKQIYSSYFNSIEKQGNKTWLTWSSMITVNGITTMTTDLCESSN